MHTQAQGKEVRPQVSLRLGSSTCTKRSTWDLEKRTGRRIRAFGFRCYPVLRLTQGDGRTPGRCRFVRERRASVTLEDATGRKFSVNSSTLQNAAYSLVLVKSGLVIHTIPYHINLHSIPYEFEHFKMTKIFIFRNVFEKFFMGLINP